MHLHLTIDDNKIYYSNLIKQINEIFLKQNNLNKKVVF